MSRFFLIFLIAFVNVNAAFSQTLVTVIGSIHEKTTQVDPGAIKKLLDSIQPDVILLELDTTLMDQEGNFKFDFKNINELQASEMYRTENPNTLLRAIDVPDRNNYYKLHSTFATESRIFKKIDMMYDEHSLNSSSTEIVKGLYQANTQLDSLNMQSLQVINQPFYVTLSEHRQELLYQGILKVIKSTPELATYFTFYETDAAYWDYRNETMVKNTLAATTRHKNKNIVVLIGSYHKYALLKKLSPMQEKFHFKLSNNLKIK